MKKYLIGFFFLIMTGGVLMGKPVEATKQVDSYLGITFAKEEPVITQPPIIENPIFPVENVVTIPPKKVGKLPSTGDLITSVIWMLLGFSVVIVVVGVFSLKNIMLKITWE